MVSSTIPCVRVNVSGLSMYICLISKIFSSGVVGKAEVEGITSFRQELVGDFW